jgi:hypothetical protein
MKNFLKTMVICGTAIIIGLSASTDCYAQKQKKVKKPKTKAEAVKAPEGYKLSYNFPAGEPLSYHTRTNMYQTMDFNGSTMNANVLSVLSCTVTSKGTEGANQKIEVRIDTMSQMIDTPQGGAGGVINEVAGKIFAMVLSPTGKEVDVSDAEKIVFSVEGVETNMSQSFIDYFPDLPANPIKPGDVWTTNDTVSSKSAAATIMQIIKADNKFEGIVTLDGIECAKITSILSGTRQQNAQTMGMDIATSGTFTGTGELYFAIKEGYYVRQTGNSKMNGTLEITSQGMSMPLVADIVAVSQLKK